MFSKIGSTGLIGTRSQVWWRGRNVQGRNSMNKVIKGQDDPFFCAFQVKGNQGPYIRVFDKQDVFVQRVDGASFARFAKTFLPEGTEIGLTPLHRFVALTGDYVKDVIQGNVGWIESPVSVLPLVTTSFTEQNFFFGFMMVASQDDVTLHGYYNLDGELILEAKIVKGSVEAVRSRSQGLTALIDEEGYSVVDFNTTWEKPFRLSPAFWAFRGFYPGYEVQPVIAPEVLEVAEESMPTQVVALRQIDHM